MTTTALWQPAWYELDQAIAVGVVGTFGFVKHESVQRSASAPLMFATGLTDQADVELVDVMIGRISHAILGDLRSVDTRGLTYTFALANGATFRVDAEHAPGTVEGVEGDSADAGVSEQKLVDWQLQVELALQAKET